MCSTQMSFTMFIHIQPSWKNKVNADFYGGVLNILHLKRNKNLDAE